MRAHRHPAAQYRPFPRDYIQKPEKGKTGIKDGCGSLWWVEGRKKAQRAQKEKGGGDGWKGKWEPRMDKDRWMGGQRQGTDIGILAMGQGDESPCLPRSSIPPFPHPLSLCAICALLWPSIHLHHPCSSVFIRGSRIERMGVDGSGARGCHLGVWRRSPPWEGRGFPGAARRFLAARGLLPVAPRHGDKSPPSARRRRVSRSPRCSAPNSAFSSLNPRMIHPNGDVSTRQWRRSEVSIRKSKVNNRQS